MRAYLARTWLVLCASRWSGWLTLGVILGLAAFFRFWAAPLSAGPDVAQFWAFAKVFQLHGLDFYRYADASLDIFPYQGWGFVYPPLWLLLLGLGWLAAPASVATDTMIDAGWRLAVKTPIIVADLAIGLLLYWAVPGSKLRKLVFAGLWLFHPTAWYESAVFGQFDAIATVFLLGAVIMLLKGREWLAFLCAGLAVITKQHTFIALAMMVVCIARGMSRRRLLADGAIVAGVVVVFSIPFLVTGNIGAYASSLFLPGAAPGYQNPLCFSLSGSGTLLTYLHNTFGWDTGGLMTYLIPVVIIALIAVAILSYRRGITPLQGALAGMLVFIALFYRVNYQYMVVFIPLALLLAARTRYRGERVFALGLALLPAVWIWLVNIPWWFNDFQPANPWVTPLLARAGLPERYLPDYAYVVFASVLMGLALTYVGLALWRWRQPAAPAGGSRST